MSEAAILLKRFPFEHGGKSWELGRPNLGTEAAHGRYLLAKEAKFIEHEREAVSDITHQAALRLHMSNGINDWFGWASPGFRDSMQSLDNRGHFLWLWFTQKTTTGPADFVSEASMQAFYRDPEVEPKLTKLLIEAMNDPNPLPLD